MCLDLLNIKMSITINLLLHTFNTDVMSEYINI